jgi:ABC-2 type transport system ATP-binding protein
LQDEGPLLKISNLTIRYPQVTALDNVSLELKSGTIYGLVGPNGAGKSSLIKALVGQIVEYEGQIKYDDFFLHRDRQFVKSLYGYAPEDPDLFPYLSGREYLQMIAEIRKSKLSGQIKNVAADFGMSEVMDKLINGYSHGMRQKISLAAALIGEPKYLILDEALNGLDPVSLIKAKNMLQILAREGTTVLLSSHVLEMLEQWCQEIIILNEGKVLAVCTPLQIEAIKKETGKTFADHFISLIQGSPS